MEGHLAGKTGISVFFPVWFIAKATAQFSQEKKFKRASLWML